MNNPLSRLRILYISGFIQPFNVIASVRTEKLAKYASMHCEYSVLSYDTEYSNRYIDKNFAGRSDNIDVFRFGRFSSKLFYAIINKTNHSKSKNKIRIILRRMLSLFKFFLCFTLSIPKLIYTLKHVKPDIVVASYGPHFIIWLGIISKLLDNKIKLVYDLRDPIVGHAHNKHFLFFDKLLVNLYRANCDAVIGASPWVIKNFNHRNKKIITNGYDEEEISNILKVNDNKNDNECDFSYTRFLIIGTLYELSNPKLLFDAIAKSNIDSFSIEYAGSNFEKLFDMTPVNLRGKLINHGYLNKEEIILLEKSVDFLVLLTWNNEDEQDVYTGKLFEYIGVKNSIICLIDGNAPNSSVVDIIMKSEAGKCFQYLNDYENELNNLVEYIENKSNNSKTSVEHNLSESYSYSYIAKEYLNFLEGIVDL